MLWIGLVRKSSKCWGCKKLVRWVRLFYSRCGRKGLVCTETCRGLYGYCTVGDSWWTEANTRVRYLHMVIRMVDGNEGFTVWPKNRNIITACYYIIIYCAYVLMADLVELITANIAKEIHYIAFCVWKVSIAESCVWEIIKYLVEVTHFWHSFWRFPSSGIWRHVTGYSVPDAWKQQRIEIVVKGRNIQYENLFLYGNKAARVEKLFS